MNIKQGWNMTTTASQSNMGFPTYNTQTSATNEPTKLNNNELTQNKIDIYSSVESQSESTDNFSHEISYQDINDIYQQQNRSEFIQNLNSSKETLHF